MGASGDLIPVSVGIAAGLGLIIAFSLLFGAPAVPSSLDNTVISMKRTVCFGSCPDYELTIYGNGTVIYEGHNFVAITGKRSAIVPSEDVRELVSDFYDINYFSLRDEYTAQVTDLPTTTTSIRIDGRFKQIIDYYGAPEELRQLEDKIDDIANSEIWIKG